VGLDADEIIHPRILAAIVNDTGVVNNGFTA
jgi:hypothetical protein